jgi:Protein of unknown function (DUF1592)/Protein of unknown function (DUF1588)/Protein of unknown function (DUF1595)/Protein of unknown function (DUF1587)/Protein of unknown function (DUF1585)
MATVLASVGCVGNIGSAGDGDGVGSGPTGGTSTGTGTVDPTMPVISGPTRPAAPLRRLSRLQYNNTVRDLLGDTSLPADRFQAEEVLGTYSGSAALARVSPIAADQYRNAAETLAATAVKKLSALVSCTPADKATEEACATTFITDFGLRAYRRPLTADEITGKLEVFRKVRAVGEFALGIQGVIAALLQSPHFLYRPELTAVGSTVGTVVALGPYQVASRLSYFLLNTMPDQELFTAAKANRLASPEDIDVQARRLLKDPRAREAVGQFFGEWLILNALDDMTKDATLFPDFNDTLKAAMKQETLRFSTATVLDGDALLNTLLTSSQSFINAPLGKLYGVVAGAEYGPVMLDPMQRSGLLTHASLLTRTAHDDSNSPTRRGKFVREAFMCQSPPPPPPGIPPLPAVKTGQTARERYKQHVANPTCATCHTMMDPVGFGFENYDAIGKYRTMEGGQPVDASGEVLQSEDLDGKFNGAVELSKKLAGSNNVRTCLASQWFRYALGRIEDAGDSASIMGAVDAFAPSGDLRELIIATTKTDSFRARIVEVP